MISRERQKHTGKPSNLNSDFYDCLKACDLEDKDLRGKSDPYAVITYEDQAGFSLLIIIIQKYSCVFVGQTIHTNA